MDSDFFDVRVYVSSVANARRACNPSSKPVGRATSVLVAAALQELLDVSPAIHVSFHQFACRFARCRTHNKHSDDLAGRLGSLGLVHKYPYSAPADLEHAVPIPL